MFNCYYADQVLIAMLSSGQSSMSRSTHGEACACIGSTGWALILQAPYPAADMKALKAELERVLSNRHGLQQRVQLRTGLPTKAEEHDEELRYATNRELARCMHMRSIPSGALVKLPIL